MMFKDENRAQELRSRILARVSRPCTGRFDKCFDLEHEFTSDVSRYKHILLDAEKDPDTFEDDKYYIFGLLEELDWAESCVRGAWKRQDDAIEAQKFNVKPPQKEVDPSQTVLF